MVIRFSGLPETLAFIACGIFVVGILLAFILIPNRRRTAYGVIILCVFVIIGWSQVTPSHDRKWEPSVAKLPYTKTEGDQIQIHNIRNFDYRTEKDFSVRYYDKSYDLTKLETVDYVLVYWDGNEAVAHSIFSFGFAGGDYLTVSVEKRLEKGEPQSSLRGLFKQYELIYILGDEKDLLRLRTNYRREEVFLYPINMDKETVRKVFNVIMERVNSIASEPEFYNTLTQSCLSSLVGDLKRVITPKSSFDYRRLANGFSDELLYENGWIDSKLSFPETKKMHYINQYVQDDKDGSDYSRKIRPHIIKNNN
jgi:hypothetical protein